MRNVAVVCLCLSLCLWTNVDTAAPISVPFYYDNIFKVASESTPPGMKVNWIW